MRLFGNRKKEEEVDEPSKKDLEKPKRTRRKKEEPPKPWGKSERYLVLLVMGSTVIIAVFLAMGARSWKLPGLPRLSLPKGVLEETYVFEGKPPEKDSTIIIEKFKSLTKELSGVYGLYVVNLNTDETFGANEDEVFTAASLIKLPVMAAMYSEHEKGNINLDKKYLLKDEDRVGGSGSVVYKETGTEYSYRELVNLMGQQSDNTAWNVAEKLLKSDFIENYIKEIGMTSTSYETNQTTPRDIGIYFKKLWTGKLIKKSNRDEILKSLTETIYEDLIPKGITGTRIAHKYGAEVHVLNDAGIVFGSEPYVLVIMSKGVIEEEARNLFPSLSASVHSFVTEE
jgi:beta-lactamase class A